MKANSPPKGKGRENMSLKKWLYPLCFYALVSLVPATPALAQLTSPAQTVILTANATESIGVAISVGGPVIFTLTGGSTDAGSVAPAWTTSWNLKPARTSVAVCAYLTGALTGTGVNTDTIPAANVLAQADSSGGFNPLTGTACGAGNAVTIHTYPLTTTATRHATQTDSVALEINDSALTLEADTYSGTLNIVAQATP
jgi:hypothetical protein